MPAEPYLLCSRHQRPRHPVPLQQTWRQHHHHSEYALKNVSFQTCMAFCVTQKKMFWRMFCPYNKHQWGPKQHWMPLTWQWMDKKNAEMFFRISSFLQQKKETHFEWTVSLKQTFKSLSTRCRFDGLALCCICVCIVSRSATAVWDGRRHLSIGYREHSMFIGPQRSLAPTSASKSPQQHARQCTGQHPLPQVRLYSNCSIFMFSYIGLIRLACLLDSST